MDRLAESYWIDEKIHTHYDTFVDLLVEFDYCETEEVADDWLSTELNVEAMSEALLPGYPHKERMRFILDMIYHLGLDCYPEYSTISVRTLSQLI